MADPKQTNVTITGDKELIRKLKALGPKALQVATGSLYRSAEEIMTDSKENYVPVDTGALRGTGKVLPPVMEGNQVTVVLGYGDESVNYAVHVHENPDAYHPVGGWKYLEAPAKKAIKNIQEALKDDIEDACKSL